MSSIFTRYPKTIVAGVAGAAALAAAAQKLRPEPKKQDALGFEGQAAPNIAQGGPLIALSTSDDHHERTSWVTGRAP